ncbi:MAG: hypothetical protein L6Q92_05790 [Phycisphaerae bacterium]|nr:hypothetical protein [Phycisphaerae bacterium]
MAPPNAPSTELLKRAHELLEYGIASTNSLADLYDTLTESRGRGAPTHEDQDLLRAMLVMAGATLDIVVKRIIRDSLHALVTKNAKALKAARDHVHRRLLKTIDDRGGQRLAEALLSESPQAAIVGFIIDDITGESLQSVEELQRAAGYLGLEGFQVPQGVRDALAARNQIVHEMDAIETQTRGRGSRRRRQRKKDEMRTFAKQLLDAAAMFCTAVNGALANAG